jgi:hypothetical protein
MDDWAVFDALDHIDLHPHESAVAWLVATYGDGGMQLSSYEASACLGLTRSQYYVARRRLYDRGFLTIVSVPPDPQPTPPIILLNTAALLTHQAEPDQRRRPSCRVSGAR